MERYVLGVDGGGTKTHCALFDLAGNGIDMINWGPTSHEVLKGGFKELESELSSLFHHVLEKNGIGFHQIARGVFGFAGIDTCRQQELISGIISRLGFKDFILCNDAFLSVKAGCPQGYGVGIINGTGCCVAGIDPGGRLLQVGGLGHLTGDVGGGAGLGEAAIRVAYTYFFRCGGHTLMAGMLLEELGITSKYELVECIHRKISKGEIRISDLNRLVFEAANMGDEVATAILEKVGEELAASANGALKELKFGAGKKICIVLAGSIHLKGNHPALVDKLKESIVLQNPGREIEFVLLERPPATGAAIWALESVLGREAIREKFFS